LPIRSDAASFQRNLFGVVDIGCPSSCPLINGQDDSNSKLVWKLLQPSGIQENRQLKARSNELH
jgi:hypothetical protein